MQIRSNSRRRSGARGFANPLRAEVIPTVITHSHPGDLFILRNGERTLEVVAANYHELSTEEKLAVTSEENVLVQMENLRTYPVVQKAAREGRLHVHAWFFEIGTGKVFRYSPDKGQYEPISYGEE
jgi:hypothetical protein